MDVQNTVKIHNYRRFTGKSVLGEQKLTLFPQKSFQLKFQTAC